MEQAYMKSYLRSFQKTVVAALHNIVIVDNINVRQGDFTPFWVFAKSAGFEVYLVELSADLHLCADRNVHAWTLAELELMKKDWEPVPPMDETFNAVLMDVRGLMGEKMISEVEMGDESADDEQGAAALGKRGGGGWRDNCDSDDEADNDNAGSSQPDGTDAGAGAQAGGAGGRRKKRVRWADVEAEKDAADEAARGFSIGLPQLKKQKLKEEQERKAAAGPTSILSSSASASGPSDFQLKMKQEQMKYKTHMAKTRQDQDKEAMAAGPPPPPPSPPLPASAAAPKKSRWSDDDDDSD